MKPHSRDKNDLEVLERELRAGADAFRRVPPAGMRARVLAELGRLPRERRALPSWSWLAAAAVLFLGLGGWRLYRTPSAVDVPAQGAGPRAQSVVLLSRELLWAGTRVLDLPAEAEGSLRVEARNLLLDASRAAEGVVRGLPAPLRAPMARL